MKERQIRQCGFCSVSSGSLRWLSPKSFRLSAGRVLVGSMNCVGKSADRRLTHVSFHLDERGGCLELLQCGETGINLYECRQGALHRVFDMGE